MDILSQIINTAQMGLDGTLSHKQAIGSIRSMVSATLRPLPADMDLTKALKAYLSTKEATASKVSLLTGHVWDDDERGILVFRMDGFIRYLGYASVTRKQVMAAIFSVGGGKRFVHYENDGLRCWYVPADFLDD